MRTYTNNDPFALPIETTKGEFGAFKSLHFVLAALRSDVGESLEQVQVLQLRPSVKAS